MCFDCFLIGYEKASRFSLLVLEEPDDSGPATQEFPQRPKSHANLCYLGGGISWITLAKNSKEGFPYLVLFLVM